MLVQITKRINQEGGKIYLVGGAVRDAFLHLENKDIDVEIYGLMPIQLKQILSEFGKVDEVGQNFGIYMIHGTPIDFSIPRREIKGRVDEDNNIVYVPYSSEKQNKLILQKYPYFTIIRDRTIEYGHKDFIVLPDPYMSIEEATKRRDLRINSIYKDLMTGKIIDIWGGVKDIKNKIIHHVDSKTFVEDPLRVLRICQFAARFQFEVDEDTKNLCRKIDLTTLPKERIYEELKKALMKSKKPSIAFELMKEIGVLNQLFPELLALSGCKQNPIHHPEGDAWVHTMMVLDEASKLKDKASDPEIFMFSALLHDIGKPATSSVINEEIKSYGHDKAGIPIAEQVMLKITNEKRLIDGVKKYVEYHMRPFFLYDNNATDKAIRRLSAEMNIEDLLLFSEADGGGRKGKHNKIDDIHTWFRNKIDSLGVSKGIPPLVQGRDLIELGMKPGQEFGKILAKAFDLQLSGSTKGEILEQIRKE